MLDAVLYFLASVGGIVVFAVAGLIIALILHWIQDMQAMRCRDQWHDGRTFERNILEKTSWWFSEDDATMLLLQDLAKGTDIAQVREEWRKRIKKEKVVNDGE